eukprot:Opistho-2@8434
MLHVAGTLYVFGGQSSNSHTNGLYAFDIASRTWRQLSPSGTAPAGVSQHAGVVLDARRLLFAGGLTVAGTSRLNVVYNIALNAWVQGESRQLAKAAHSMSLVVFVQSAKTDVCVYPEATYLQICVPQSQPMILAFGGIDPDGVSANLAGVFSINEDPQNSPSAGSSG